jgi:transcriptional regulator with XRE-family HTH domain
VARDAKSALLVAFGASVRALRTSHGWSQEDFADRVGIHRTYVGDVERGERNLGLVNVARVADALGVTLASLMAEVDRRRDGGVS